MTMSLNRTINLMFLVSAIMLVTLGYFSIWVIPKIIGVLFVSIPLIAVCCASLVFSIIIISSACMILTDNGDLYCLNFKKTKLENFILHKRSKHKEGIFKVNSYGFSPKTAFRERYDKGFDIVVVEDRAEYDILKKHASDISITRSAIIVYHHDKDELTWDISSVPYNFFGTTSSAIYAKFKLRA